MNQMSGRQITVKDIALRLNLHHTTVSKALRNHPDISRETKNLILSVAKEMDYHPNSLAKSLRNRRSMNLGVVVPTIRNDFFSTLISGIENVAYREGYNIIVSQSNEDFEREKLIVNGMVSNLVAGLLISVSQTTRSCGHLEIFQKRKIPLVCFDRVCENFAASRVVVDDFAGAFEAVEHLVSTGRKKIAHFSGFASTLIGRKRRRGYEAALEKHGLPVRPEWVLEGGFQEEDGMRAFARLGDLPEAVFTVNDPVAIGAYQEIKKRGLRIPQDLAVAGFGDNILSSYLDPPLTTVKQSPHEIGRISAEILLDQIRNPESSAGVREEIVKTELVVRNST
jgi:DNA-binding LacI/PurR family transcriptional regulator